MEIRDLAASLEKWCGAEEVLVQFLPGITHYQCKTGAEHIELATAKDVNGKQGVIGLPFMVGKLSIVGELLELRYRQDSRTWVVVAIDPKHVQNVTRVERSLIE